MRLSISIVILIISILSSADVQAQSLSFYGDVMLSARDAEHRVYAAKRFKSMLLESLSQESSYSMTFDDIPGMSKVYSPDRRYRILSWQVHGTDDAYTYHSILQYSSGIYMSSDPDGADAIDTESIISWADWTGALVYDLFVVGEETYLFTFRQIDEHTKVKTCEIINVGDAQATLGKYVLATSDSQASARLALSYSADANATLTFDANSSRLVYDNLASVMGRMEGQGPTQVPDGTYRAIEYSDGSWSAVEHYFDQAPTTTPTPRRKKESKDIFGRSRKKN